MPVSEQQIRFCTSSDGARIAYATVGAGPPLVKAANWLSHLEFDWNSPVWRHWIRGLSRDHTLIRYDERGCGLSDWAAEEFSLDAWVSDLEAVVDRLGLERFPLLGISQGGPIAMAYAVRHPERVSRLILYGSYSRGRSHRNLSEREREERDVMLRMIAVGWGQDHAAFRQVFTSLFIPGASPEQAHWFNELQRVSASPENAVRIARTFDELDARELAPRLDLPTLVLHATGDLRIPFAEGRLLASLIPGARFVPLESRNHILLESEPAWSRFLREVRSFLGVSPEEDQPVIGTARRQQIESLFDQAIELPPEDRPALLSRACGSDSDLRREVETLLAFAERSGLTAKLAAAVAGARIPSSAVGPGRTVSQYEILEQLGGGGMGVVYKALDRRLQRLVALKFLPPYLGAEAELKLRFTREAKAIATLDHPNLCTIFGVEEMQDGRLFIVMPYYEGETLKQMIERGPLPLAQVLEYGIQMCAGLAHAHAAGVVHRDIKPANVVVTPEGKVKILDFGIAKVSDMNLTRTGAVLGTLAYMSPEQACGELVDHRTDLWALGVVLYEMLTGRPPFTGESREALFFGIQYREPPRIATLRPQVSPEQEAVVSRLLNKEPARRYDDARAVGAALEESRGRDGQ
jgi:pimeloyl-ACP methyl ester carboxylesterase